MGKLRDLWLGLAMAGLGAAVAGLYGVSTLPAASLPTFYLPSVAAFFVVGAAFFGLWGWTIWREDRFHKSEALDIEFEGDDSVYHFPGWPQPHLLGTHTVMYPSQSPVDFQGRDYPYPQEPATAVRLRVKNLRTRSLKAVRVTLVEVLSADGYQSGWHDTQLRWMHDNGPERFTSLDGKTFGPGYSTYIDLATKGHLRQEYVLEYASPGLREMSCVYGPTYVHLRADGDDAETGHPAPPCNRFFLIAPTDDGGLTVEGTDRRTANPASRPFAELVSERQISTSPMSATSPVIIAGTPSRYAGPALPATPSLPSTPHTEGAPRQ
jgi:hypothetical protein